MQPQEPQPPQPLSESPQPSYQASYDSQPAPVHNPLEVMQPGERTICEIKRHPIGLFGLYASITLILLLVVVFGYGLGPSLFTELTKSQVYMYSTIALVVTGLASLIALLVGHIVYWGNRWIITSDSVTQVTQLTPFNNQTSQLSLGNIEDVTTEKSGLLPYIFNYGSLKTETAGEHQKFKMSFCPDPNRYAKLILQARDDFEQEHYRLSTAEGRAGAAYNKRMQQ